MMDERVAINLDPANPHEAADEAMAAIMGMPGDPAIFQRGGQLVHVARQAPVTARQKAVGMRTLAICPATLHYVRELLARAAIFRARRWRKGEDGRPAEEWVVVPPPRQLAEAIIARDEWPFHELTGVLAAPTLRPDLSILDRPGYDESTGQWSEYLGDFAPVVAYPAKAEALDALDESLVVLDEFPFAAPVDRSVALAMLATGLVRTSLSIAPAFGISARVMGSGKTYLGQVAPLLAKGAPAPVTAPPRDVKEEAKLIHAHALSGEAFLFIDNYERRAVDSDALCTVQTSETYTDRDLGKSRNAVAATSFSTIITGNNLIASGDMSARMLICHLDPKTDHPEHRKFSRDLAAWLPDARYRLVPRVLTFLRGFIASGERPTMQPWSRFPEWDSLIRAAIVWAGRDDLPDPLHALRAVEKSDPRRLEHEAVMANWHAAFGCEPRPIRAAIDLARSRALTGAPDANEFKDALLDVAGERGEVNPKRLGHWLRKMAGRIHGGMRIVAGEHSRGAATWAVEKVEAA